ncbi:UPF0104 family protein [Methanotorris igneus]|uniref:Lysylphosphatidylglycerol synthetase/UPF0104 n=1 Tax=Methanotorris igneus (strain DSM 5666 / JCM 11834 / Kol 5) TaxID=880724 RepID=F6BBT9_METIK|nr:UPF0104 family protein [Methanotorris igneus]AEF97219.1 Lysylphosphatidylglycerol synthetase/UPF0104 [Methanotorris igneus Kol 5]
MANKSKTKILRNLLFFILGILIIFAIIFYIGIYEIIEVLMKTNPVCFTLAFFIYLFTLVALVIRWKYLIRIIGFNAKFKNLFLLILMGQFINNITPSMKGGSEPFRAYYLSKLENIPYHITFSTVVVERLLDSAVFLLLTSIVILYFLINGIMYAKIFILVWFLILCLTILSIYILMHKRLAFRIVLKITKLISKFSSKTFDEEKINKSIEEFQNSLLFFKGRKKELIVCGILSLLWWILDIFRVYIIFVSISYFAPFFVIAATYLISLLVGILPTLPGGLGTSDTVMIATYSVLNVPSSIAAVGTLLDRFISYWLATLMGAIALKVIRIRINMQNEHENFKQKN